MQYFRPGRLRRHGSILRHRSADQRRLRVLAARPADLSLSRAEADQDGCQDQQSNPRRKESAPAGVDRTDFRQTREQRDVIRIIHLTSA